MGIDKSGYYAWVNRPKSERQIEDERLLTKIKQFWMESGCVYGYRNITLDLKDDGETTGKHRVRRIMKASGISAQRGYRRRPRSFSGGAEIIAAPNTLSRQFDVSEPDKYWVTDFTYIKTHEGWLYLTIVVDLYSRRVIGWSMKNRATSDLVVDALLMAIYRRQPRSKVLVHSDQGIQYKSRDWRSFCDANNLEISMSRRGNCHDNAVSESFFSLLKKDRIRNRTYSTRSEARSDIFDYIEFFYNPKRRHGTNGGLSPANYEEQYFRELESV